MFLNVGDVFTAQLQLQKNGAPISGATPQVLIKRNSDGRYLKPSTGNWNLTEDWQGMAETWNGIYTYSLDISLYNKSYDSYTIIYKYENYTESEIVYYKAKNRSKLV